MPFTKVNVGKTIEKKKRENPEFKKVWDDSREEYRLIEEMTVLRKAERITQRFRGLRRKKTVRL